MNLAVIGHTPPEKRIEALTFQRSIGGVVVFQMLNRLGRPPVEDHSFFLGIDERLLQDSRYFFGDDSRIIGYVGADESRIGLTENL